MSMVHPLPGRRERRSTRRVVTLISVAVRPADDTGTAPLLTHTIDLSPGGLLLSCVGTPDEVRLVLELRDPVRHVDVLAKVVRREPGRTAFAFDGLTAAESNEIQRALRRPGALAA